MNTAKISLIEDATTAYTGEPHLCVVAKENGLSTLYLLCFHVYVHLQAFGVKHTGESNGGSYTRYQYCAGCGTWSEHHRHGHCLQDSAG